VKCAQDIGGRPRSLLSLATMSRSSWIECIKSQINSAQYILVGATSPALEQHYVAVNLADAQTRVLVIMSRTQCLPSVGSDAFATTQSGQQHVGDHARLHARPMLR
jgi:hypothetical protein